MLLKDAMRRGNVALGVSVQLNKRDRRKLRVGEAEPGNALMRLAEGDPLVPIAEITAEDPYRSRNPPQVRRGYRCADRVMGAAA